MRPTALATLLLLASFAPGLSPRGGAQTLREVQDYGLQSLAESGDAEGQFQLGLRYFTGRGARQDIRAALKWLEAAAEQGHAKAMLVVGSIYEEGDETARIEPDLAKALKWYEGAAKAGLPEGNYQLGLLYIQGKGVKVDFALAAKWLKPAADKGHAASQAMYAAMLLDGEGVPRNPAKAALWYLRAARQDHALSQRRLANLYFAGIGVPVDYARCQAWYRRAATLGQDPWAKNDLAWFLSTCPDASYHNGKEAARLAKEASQAIADLDRQRGEQRHEVVDTVAASLARNGQFEEAVVWQQTSLKLLTKDTEITEEGRKQLKEEFTARLKLYQAGKPYADPVPKSADLGDPLPNDSVLEDAAKPSLKPAEDGEDSDSKGKGKRPAKNVT
jgi:TPR repeat protein